jgi:alanine racemase
VIRYRPTVVEVDLDAIRHNVRLLMPPGAELMAVVKGDGYGHGDTHVARAALDAGATWLGVAMVEEGLRLRDHGIAAPMLVLSEFPPGSEKEALAANLVPSLYTEDGLAGVLEAANAVGRPVGVHVKVDTGMHRVGVWPAAAAAGFAREVAAAAGLELDGLWTHFASAEEDGGLTRRQLGELVAVDDELRGAGIRARVLHAANSAATLLYPETHLDMVRPGAAIYGLDPGNGLAVTMVKRLPAGEPLSYGHRYRLQGDASVATVPVGYEDGYARALSSGADVLIRGRRHRVAGTVTMDQILVDCGDGDVATGDDVVLIGEQGDERVTAEELAGIIGTIGYEVVTSISERVPREYRG